MMKPREPLILPTREGYDRWSEVYDTDGNPLVHLEEPHVERLLGDVRGLAVLDVACGTGRHTVRLARAGANIIGVDFSEGMLSKARAKADDGANADGGAGIEASAGAARFLHHDVATPLPFEGESFDRVLCCLVLDHIPELRPLYSELRRVCRPTGFAVLSVMHPAMMLKGVQARFHDAATGAEIRPRSASHQVTDYLMAALASGFDLQEVSEHAVDESLVARAPRAARYRGWPMLLMMKLAPSTRSAR